MDYSQDVNCKGYWAMQDTGTELDLSDNNEDLTVVNGPIPVSADVPSGYSGTSRDFESGDSQYLTHANGGSTDISGVNQTMSICCWFKREATDVNHSLLTKYDWQANEEQYILNIASIDVVFFTFSPDGTDANGISARGGTDIAAATWYHTVGVYNDIDIRVYLDSSLDASANNPKNYSGGIFAANIPFALGSLFKSGAPDEFMDGLIDDAAIFDRVLSTVEISDIYTNGVNGLKGAVANPYPTSLLKRGFISGYHCYMNAYIGAKITGFDPLKLPDGTIF